MGVIAILIITLIISVDDYISIALKKANRDVLNGKKDGKNKERKR